MDGSPSRGKIRTFLELSVVATLRSFYKRSKVEGVFEVRDLAVPSAPQLVLATPAKRKRERRNPISLAEEWQQRMTEGRLGSRAELARALGVSRARVTQVLSLLELSPRTIEAVRSLGDPLVSPALGERYLRSLLSRSESNQFKAVQHRLRKSTIDGYSV